MKTFKLALTAAATLALCTSVAQASPIVTSWSVTNTDTFVNPILPGGNTFPNPVLSSGGTALSWGNTSLATQSSLVIANSGLPIVVPDATLTSTVQITHNNFVIPAGTSLTSADILASLTLTSATPTVGSPLSFAPIFTMSFLETPNAGTAGFCADGAAVGSGGVNGSGVKSACADIFVISQNALNFQFLYDSDGAVNGFDPEPYFVSFFATGLGSLSNSACAAAGAAAGCRGFETAEGVSTTVDFRILIASAPFQVPEPGSVALIGGALTALAWVGRRRKPLQSCK